MVTYDIIIIGGGPSGMTAALYALRNNRSVLIIEKESFGGQIATSPRLENFPTIKEISGLNFADSYFEQITALGANFELEEVISIKKEKNIFKVTTNYHTYESKTVIISNGVSHRHLGLENEEKLVGKGVSYCAVCDGPFYKGKEVNIIGDANTALQYALLLTNYCPKVHMFTLFDKLFADKILIDRVLSHKSIDIRRNVSLIKMDENDDMLCGLTFQDTKTKETFNVITDNVFIAIGQVPHNEIFKNLVDLEKGFIVTNENMETKTPGLYAVGDTRKKQVRQVISACSDGAIAAVNADMYLNTL